MLQWEIIAVCFEIHMKRTTAMCWQNVELMNVKPGGTQNNYQALND
jgi:hypothetical protein